MGNAQAERQFESCKNLLEPNRKMESRFVTPMDKGLSRFGCICQPHLDLSQQALEFIPLIHCQLKGYPERRLLFF
jgi:hypothetical protein